MSTLESCDSEKFPSSSYLNLLTQSKGSLYICDSVIQETNRSFKTQVQNSSLLKQLVQLENTVNQMSVQLKNESLFTIIHYSNIIVQKQEIFMKQQQKWQLDFNIIKIQTQLVDLSVDINRIKSSIETIQTKNKRILLKIQQIKQQLIHLKCLNINLQTSNQFIYYKIRKIQEFINTCLQPFWKKDQIDMIKQKTVNEIIVFFIKQINLIKEQILKSQINMQSVPFFTIQKLKSVNSSLDFIRQSNLKLKQKISIDENLFLQLKRKHHNLHDYFFQKFSEQNKKMFYEESTKYNKRQKRQKMEINFLLSLIKNKSKNSQNYIDALNIIKKKR